MTTIERTATDFHADFHAVTVDLYRDIHKGIRYELFGVTTAAGNTDPADRDASAALAERVGQLVGLLVSHAEHEDTAVQPTIERYLPDVAATIANDHVVLEARMTDLVALARDAVDATADRRRHAHRLYLELASFTSSYLAHQDLEERTVMPAIEAAIGPEATLAIHQSIVGSIPPDEMAFSLSLMLPGMNVDDRAELLAGLRAGAPAPVFEGVWGLAGAVLSEADHVALAARLGVH